MDKNIYFTITPAPQFNALDILCTDFSGIEWLPEVVKEKFPASELRQVNKTRDGENFFCRILLHSDDDDSENAAAWLSQKIVERGGLRTSESLYEFMLAKD